MAASLTPLETVVPICDAVAECLQEARTDRASGLVTNVVLLGPLSRNGYRYSAAAMAEAAPRYEGRPMFIDHAEAAPTRRHLRDFAGQVVRARLVEDRLRGDLRLLGPNAGWLLDLIEAAPADIGLSHVVLGRRSADGKEVVHIEQVLTVDIVAFPATTRSFREQLSPFPNPSPVFTPINTLDDERWQEFQRLLDHSRIPPEGRQEALRQLLGNSADPRGLLAALEKYWDQVRRAVPRSSERASSSPDSLGIHPAQRQAVIRAIRGR
jgi:hypothetical protein